MEYSKIEWCDHTFNPWIGCAKVSEGCKHCYAESMNRRYGWAEWGPNGKRKKTSVAYWRKPLAWNRKAEQDGIRHKVFCGSLCDVFEDNDQVTLWRGYLFDLIGKTPNLDWLLLTKRPENVFSMLPYFYPNVWLGTTVENQRRIERIVQLVGAQATKHFISAEPMLSSVVLGSYIHHIDWVICGGESGPGCRPFNVEWARNLLAQCRSAGVPFFMKQLGGHPNKRDKMSDFPADLRVREFPDGD